MLFGEKNIEEAISGEPKLEKGVDNNHSIIRMTRKLKQKECENDAIIQVIREKFERVWKDFELANELEEGWPRRERISLLNDMSERLEKSLNERLEKLKIK